MSMNPGFILALLALPGLVYLGNPAFALLVGTLLSLIFNWRLLSCPINSFNYITD